MAYARIQNGTVAEYPLSVFDIQKKFPNTSFTSPFVPPSGYVDVVDLQQPQASFGQKAIEKLPSFINGQWRQQWQLVVLSEEESRAALFAKSTEIRNERNKRLLESDWTQLPDTPVDAEPWKIYRQQLRDITNAGGFPFSVQWPVPPA
jgi:hypothetical protein